MRNGSLTVMVLGSLFTHPLIIVVKTIQFQMIELMNNELEGMWKWSWPNLRCNPRICLEELRKTMKNHRIASFQPVVFSHDLLNMKQDCKPPGCGIQLSLYGKNMEATPHVQYSKLVKLRHLVFTTNILLAADSS
jgi:hypothetical protein